MRLLPPSTLPVALALAGLVCSQPASSAELRQPQDYRVIMWMGGSPLKHPEKAPLFFQRMKEMGVNTGMIHHDGDVKPFVDAQLPFFLENIVNKGLCLKFNSHVSDWNKVVTAWRAERNEKDLIRDYSLDDPAWRADQRKEVIRVAKKFAPQSPILLNLRDELSTTISANPFDYDFSPTALAGFRDWLKTQYADLAALNAQWETTFRTWDDVKPFTTDQIKNRMSGGVGREKNGAGLPQGNPDWQAVQKIAFDPTAADKAPLAWNLSPWCDHRTYMDLSLARALDDFRQAAREADPTLPIGIEGTQMPAAFGGYDLWRLSQVLDWIEPYDIGNAREILGSFMPGKPIFSTVGEQDARGAQRRLWHLLLEGDAGCLVWWSEDSIDYTKDDYPLTPRAKALAPVLKDLQGPLARLFFRASREIDPIAIHYSQPSIQVDWLLESAADGSSWLRRFSSYEAAHNKMAQRRQAWVKWIQDLGYTPQFVSADQIEHGALDRQSVLVLPDSLAMGRTEIEAIARFRERKPNARATLLGSGAFGRFDAHGRFQGDRALVSDLRLVDSRPDHLFLFQNDMTGPADSLRKQDTEFSVEKYLASRGTSDTSSPADSFMARAFQYVPRSVTVPSNLCVRTHRYRLGNARLLAFERNIVWQMGEDLKQRGGNEALEKPVTFEAKLDKPAHIYDLRTGHYLGQSSTFKVALDPWLPSLFAITPEKLPEGDAIKTLQSLK